MKNFLSLAGCLKNEALRYAGLLDPGPAMPSHEIVFTFGGFAGSDAILSYLPERWQAHVVGQALLRGPYKTVDLETTALVVRMPHGDYRVLRDRIVPCNGARIPMGM